MVSGRSNRSIFMKEVAHRQVAMDNPLFLMLGRWQQRPH